MITKTIFKYETLAKELNNNPNTIAKDTCSKCKGICCKNGGCHLAPNHFGVELTEELIIDKLKTGLYAIGWWDAFWGSDENFNGDNGCDVFYLRMRHVGEHVFYKKSGTDRWGGTCAALTETGCPLSDQERPLGGLSLIPKIEDGNTSCLGMYDIYDTAKDWLYSGAHHILRNVIEMFMNGEIETNQKFLQALHLQEESDDYFTSSLSAPCRENNPLTHLYYDPIEPVLNWH